MSFQVYLVGFGIWWDVGGEGEEGVRKGLGYYYQRGYREEGGRGMDTWSVIVDVLNLRCLGDIQMEMFSKQGCV